jgi:hypothetical protein
VFHKLRDLFRIALGLYLERKRVSGPEENCRDLQEVVVMAGNKGYENKTQGVVTKPNASPTNPQAKPVPGSAVHPRPEKDPPPISQVVETPAQEIPLTVTPTTPVTPGAAGTFAGARDLRGLPSATSVDKTLNEAVRKVFRGNINERSAAAEIFEKLNQIAPLTTAPGRTGPQPELSAPSSSVTAIGGQSVAQMSLFERAHAALADAERRLDALKPMQTPIDPENLDALRAITLATYRRLVNELGRSGGPRADRAKGHFAVLIGDPPVLTGDPPTLDTKTLLGKIHAQFKLDSGINSQEDSSNVANFNVVRDNLIDVHRSFGTFMTTRSADPSEKAARFSRLLVMIQDDVTDVETAMDESNFDETDRDSKELPDLTITIQGLLLWISEFATEEGPEMVDEGGMLGIAATFPTVKSLHSLVGILHGLTEFPVTDALVKESLKTLLDHLKDARDVAEDIDKNVNPVNLVQQ